MFQASIRAVTLGCKVNQYETDLVREGLVRAGYRDAEPGEAADLCVVNTCTVTHEADAKSRQTIRQLANRNPGARIVVMGCYATRAPGELAGLPGVVEVVTDKRKLPEVLERQGAELPSGLVGLGRRQRAFLKVQDGCLLKCSYCIIPTVRPHVGSRPLPAVLDEARRLVDAGYRELVLTGIHLGHYGVDLNRGRPPADWVRLATLVRALARLPGEFRLRLSSIEATEVTRDLLSAMVEQGDRVCPHLHISLQSGSDRILRRMRRRWGVRRCVDRCLLARRVLDHPALTTDLIVGYPGETSDDFQATCRVAEELELAKIHIFPFSPRSGTPAALDVDQIPARVKAERVAELEGLAGRLRRRFFASLQGRRLQVLVESPLAGQSGRMLGTACRHAPVAVVARTDQRRQLLEVTAGRATDDFVWATDAEPDVIAAATSS